MRTEESSPPRTNGAPSDQKPRTAAPEKTRAELRAMRHGDLLSYFRKLDPPTLQEMDGEYSALLLDQGSLLLNVVSRVAVHIPGRWLAKAFQPKSDFDGRGYNSFRRLFGVRRKLRMKTFVGASNLDGRPSYFLDYSAYTRGPLGTMVDEVRRVGPGIYLGVGRLGYTKRQRALLFPFLLEGPIASFAER